MNDDSQLIDEALAGKSAAFGQLVQKYQDRLYNTMVHVAGDADEALDVVQDAFVQAFVKLDTFRQSAAFYTWLYRIAFNIAISYHRRKKPVVSIDRTRESLGDEPISDEEGPEEQQVRKERVDQVRQAISQLSVEQRNVVVLREIDGCCYETIAEILDIPLGTVRSRLSRARMQLRELLKEGLETRG